MEFFGSHRQKNAIVDKFFGFNILFSPFRVQSQTLPFLLSIFHSENDFEIVFETIFNE